MKKNLLALTACITIIATQGCEDFILNFPGFDNTEVNDSTAVGDSIFNPDMPQNPGTPSVPEVGSEFLNHYGIAYLWDNSVIPEITVKVSLSEWNKLLEFYDEDSHTVKYIMADFIYKKGNEIIEIKEGGLRLRGNTSRRRPEGQNGQMHTTDNTDWHHCHFGINFRKNHKDDAHEIHGIRKINLKWFKDDPCYVRELYSYDLFRRYGIWTAAFSSYCRLWIHVEGDSKPAYYGVYNMIEPIDDKFISRRGKGMFENTKGFLWKCGHNGKMANLNPKSQADFHIDDDNGINYTYEFKGEEEDYADAYAQLYDFMLKLEGKGDESFYKWIKEVCDVEFLLKTYAVNVATGMWDDHWNNGNNFYLYFDSTHITDFKFWFIPYDYDNSLGTSNSIDPGTQDPYRWGSAGILMNRLMKFDEFKQIYKNALQELVDPNADLFHMNASVPRIKAWQEWIAPYIDNDTEEDTRIYDEPGYWGNYNHYRLTDTGNNNFFKVKTQTINNMR